MEDKEIKQLLIEIKTRLVRLETRTMKLAEALGHAEKVCKSPLLAGMHSGQSALADTHKSRVLPLFRSA